MRKRQTFSASPMVQVVAGVILGTLISGAILLAAVPQFRGFLRPAQQPVMHHQHAVADFGAASASEDTRYVANWVAQTRDNGAMEFVIVDKKAASVYVFDRNARLKASTPVLLGTAPGDDTAPGVGAKALEDVKPEERTTPAGRFIGQRGFNTRGEDVVWIDYNAAVSMHRVLTNNPDERRLERLATPQIDDNRISYGCINVPAEFFETQISPIFLQRRAIVYVLPELKPVRQVFGGSLTAMPRGNSPG